MRVDVITSDEIKTDPKFPLIAEIIRQPKGQLEIDRIAVVRHIDGNFICDIYDKTGNTIVASLPVQEFLPALASAVARV